MSRAVAESHRARLQRIIACVSPAIIANRREFDTQSTPVGVITVFLARGQQALLRGRHDIFLELNHRFRVASVIATSGALAEPQVVSYLYALTLADGSEIVSYHWHPDSLSTYTDPHLHLGPAATRLDSAVRPRELHKVHFPTGYVSLEQVIRLAISEFGVEPRRADWDTILSGPSA